MFFGTLFLSRLTIRYFIVNEALNRNEKVFSRKYMTIPGVHPDEVPSHLPMKFATPRLSDAYSVGRLTIERYCGRKGWRVAY